MVSTQVTTASQCPTSHYGLCETTKYRSTISSLFKENYSISHIFLACLTTKLLHHFTFSLFNDYSSITGIM